MNAREIPTTALRRRLRELARALAAGNARLAARAAGFKVDEARIRLFLEGNAASRRDKLLRQVALLAGAFPNLQRLIDAYARVVPLAAYDTGSTDGARFLRWLRRARPLSLRQQDYVACQAARFAVEAAVCANRQAYLQFGERWSVAGRLALGLNSNPRLQAVLNPVRIGARFQTGALLAGVASPPAHVVHFPLQGNIHAAVLNRAARQRLRVLAAIQPATIDAWHAALRGRLPGTGRDDLVELGQELARLGLLAFV